jgi:D-alanyl-D-alanine carboxypeptidase
MDFLKKVFIEVFRMIPGRSIFPIFPGGMKPFFLEKLWLIEKRVVLVLVMIVLGTLLLNNQSELQGYRQVHSPIEKKSSYFDAVSRLKGADSWKPEGYGSGEYLETIPIIKAGAVLDLESGDVVWSMNLKERIVPASLTKVATVMTALDVAPLEKILTVSDEASGQIPTKLGLKTGEKLTLNEAISATILTSANDAAETISDSLGQEFGEGTATFMELVNKKVAKIGALDTHFETSTGLDSDNHYSTVYDLAIIGHEARKSYPFLKEVGALSYKKIDANSDHRMFDLPNWNALLGTYPGVDGLKIGFTEKAGHSTMVSAQREGKNLLAIVIGARSLEDREIAAATLLNYGFSKYGIAEYPVDNLNLVGRFEDWRRQLTQGGP